MLKTLLLSVMMLTATIAVAQDQRPPRQGPPTTQCEEMNKLFKAIQTHRSACEVCKTNVPFSRFGPGPNGNGPRSRLGPGPGDAPRGPRGPRGPQQAPPPPAPEK